MKNSCLAVRLNATGKQGAALPFLCAATLFADPNQPFFPIEKSRNHAEATMKADDVEFLVGMAVQLDETIRKLVIDEQEIFEKLGDARVQELKEFWNQELTAEEEQDFKRSLDYWDKILMRTWANAQRARQTRAQVGQTLMKLNSHL
ncbi:hypothetical protein [Methylomonas sp. TEB]|uniref:hypothetical protein n=2 Tax=unclassified Methylomonas TaxID=2608980 RepID=UPI0039F54810